MTKPRIVCLGDLMLDVVVRAAAPLEAGTDTPGSVSFRLGGSAGNAARVVAALGGAAAMIGAVGSDRLARRLVDAMRGEGVIVHAVRVRGRTPRLLALIGPRGERSFVTDRGVADQLPPESLRAAWFARADVLHVPAYSLLNAPTSQAVLRAAALVRERGGRVSVDLASRAPLLAAGADRGLRAVRAIVPDLLFANSDEVAALVGPRGARRLLDVAPVVVVKQGSAGCSVLWRGTPPAPVLEIEVATKPLVVTDTTGAGDAFDAGFLFALVSSAEAAGRTPSAALLRRAALAGHRAAARLLTSRRPELAL
jgi:sugar/nucleoside kinase (ribokinase family)